MLQKKEQKNWFYNGFNSYFWAKSKHFSGLKKKTTRIVIIQKSMESVLQIVYHWCCFRATLSSGYYLQRKTSNMNLFMQCFFFSLYNDDDMFYLRAAVAQVVEWGHFLFPWLPVQHDFCCPSNKVSSSKTEALAGSLVVLSVQSSVDVWLCNCFASASVASESISFFKILCIL